MAYAALSSLKLSLTELSLLQRPWPFRFWNWWSRSDAANRDFVETLVEDAGFLLHFLESLHPPHDRFDEIAARNLESRIRDVACDALDILDSASVSCIMKLKGGYLKSVFQEIQSIKEDIDRLEAQQLNDDHHPQPAVHPLRAKLESDSQNSMVGFEDQLMQIKDQLTQEPNALKAIPIVGMGGIGKTTLAIHTYSDPYILDYFDIRAWITISQSYSKTSVLLDLLHSIKKSNPNKMHHETDDDDLVCRIYQVLKERRYLIVIDDIWDTDVWDAMRRAFPNDDNGSRILLTTRVTDVACAATSSSGGCLYRISPLSDDGSWNLLRTKVFGSEESCPYDLQRIGINIARKCGGLPLAIVVMGGLLSKVNKTFEGWKAVEENMTSLFSSSDDRCSEILEMSYKYLPQHLKSCFLYMATFPEDYEINVSRLTKLWIAEGFLDSVCCNQSLEDAAERYLEDLIDRSLILVSKKKRDGKMKTCKIHDMLLELCVREAECEKFLRITKIYRTKSKPCLLLENLGFRRLSIHAMGVKGFNIDVMVSSSLEPMRSFIYVGTFESPVYSMYFRKFDLLRVLDILNVRDPIDIPNVVWKCVHLRFIASKLNSSIPESSSKLKNLQTLIVGIFGNGSTLRSNEIWQMAELRHLEFVGYHVYLKDDHDGMEEGSMNFALHDGLETLLRVMNLRFTRELMLRIPNIRRLDVYYSNRFEGWSSDFELENMVNLRQLKELKFVWSDHDYLPPKLKFPHSLETLSLQGCRIPWNDLGSVVGTLPRLQVLKLKSSACEGEEWPAPHESEFQGLKVLVLKDLDLVKWNAEHNHFPALEQIVVHDCEKLEGIPLGMGDSPTLTKIELCGYLKKSALDSAYEIEQNQHDLGNDEFRLVKLQKRQFARFMDFEIMNRG